jgi:hypothetical protein
LELYIASGGRGIEGGAFACEGSASEGSASEGSASEGSAGEGSAGGDGESWKSIGASIFAMQLCRAVHQLQAKLQCRWMEDATRDHFGGVGGCGKSRLVSSALTL